ncbi:MAG: type II toxin-antitoxin system VapC family toxin [Candidatus Eremiobacteraeota bacterium]|nr:type II toxin-antitoxin system VapC family toxin [Candidatus Eremiobacteraeota bacterium]
MMVLDTNVLSELMRPEPDPTVIRWVSKQPVLSLYTTSITQSEIYHGILRLPKGKRKENLWTAACQIFSEDFKGRVLSFSTETAHPYAQLVVERAQAGRPISGFDAQIAAITACHGATIVTRNVSDFELCGVDIINPWKT